MKKKLPLIILQDILLTGLVLCIFALFHHVLPRVNPGPSHAASAPVVLTPVPVALTPAPEEAEPSQDEPQYETPWQEAFADRFTQETVVTENSYSSPEISITVDTVSTQIDGKPLAYYVADIYISRIENFQTYVENESFDRFISTPADQLAQMCGAVVSINGDYCNTQEQFGFFVRNGVLYDDRQSDGDICVLYRDGTMATYGPKDYTVEDVLAQEPYQVWKFGPMLLDANGQPLEDFNVRGAIGGRNPRSAVGYYEPGHYCFVVVDGRQKDWSVGLDIQQLAQLFADLGCKAAYNLDGGASATMTFGGELINRQSKYRQIGDILLIKEVGDQP